MSAPDALGPQWAAGLELRVREQPRLRQVSLHDETGARVGHLQWNRSLGGSDKYEPGEVVDLLVDEQHRRRGVASQLWRHAQQLDPGIRHSEAQSELGRVWVQGLYR